MQRFRSWLAAEPVHLEPWPWASYLWEQAGASPLWLVLRVFIGYEWLDTGWHKLHDLTWVGSHGETILFMWRWGVSRPPAVSEAPITLDWYRAFIQLLIDVHAEGWFAYVITAGELCVGLGLVLGAFTGLAAAGGILMNLNFLLLGALSENPIILIGEIALLLAWRNAGLIGLDRYVLPLLSGRKAWSWEPILDGREGRVRPELMDQRSKPAGSSSAGLVRNPAITGWLFQSRDGAWLWLVVRVWLGLKLLGTARDCVTDPGWLDASGTTLRTFWSHAVATPSTLPRAALSYDWYRAFLQWLLDVGAAPWISGALLIGLLVVGVALVLGAFVGIAAAITVFVGITVLLAGVTGPIPIVVVIGLMLIAAWQNAGHLGLDRYLLTYRLPRVRFHRWGLGRPEALQVMPQAAGLGQGGQHAALRRA